MSVNDEKYIEFGKKYVRSGSGVIVPKEANPFPQMRSDTFRLENTPDFGGFGGSVDWRYIHEPLNMYPELRVSEHARHITILGGDPSNYLKLHGEVEVTLGRTAQDASTFKYTESVNVYVEKRMLYNISITGIDKPDRPIHYNEFINGENTPVIADPGEAAIVKPGYESHITVGEELWAKNQPHHEVVYPVVYVGSGQFGAKEPIRRTWMPVSVPHVLADKAHYHEYLEYIVFYGTNPDDISDLGGIVEFTIGENKDDLTVFTIDKSTIFCIKPGLWHSPMDFTKINDPSRPIVFCEVSYAASFGPEAGNTVWIDGVPPRPPSAD
jgi:hypothetical protein